VHHLALYDEAASQQIGAGGSANTRRTEGLEHEDTERIRLAAIRPPRQLDARQATPALVERLEQDADREVVAAAAELLGKWSHTDTIPALEALAASEWATRSSEARDDAANALARVRS
jgi:HEAT repeat protein